MKRNKAILLKFKLGLLGLVVFLMASFGLQLNVFALAIPNNSVMAVSMCGSQNDAILTSIDFGCNGAACLNAKKNGAVKSSKDNYCNNPHSALVDLLFAIIRFISDGIGLILILSVIIAGIQYTFSRGESKEVQLATKRVQSAFTALVIFIFAYALLNFIIPNGFFGQ